MCLTGLGLNILVLFPSLVNRLTAYGIMLSRGATCVTIGILCQLCDVFKMLYFHNTRTSQEIQNMLCNEMLSASGALCPSALPLGSGPRWGYSPRLYLPNVYYFPKPRVSR